MEKVNFNSCCIDIINNTQTLSRRLSYQLGEMHATIDLGKHRERQEDAVLIMHHPSMSDFKILAVADGMGGVMGAKASNIVVQELLKWFSNLPIKIALNVNELSKHYHYKLESIDDIIRTHCGKAGSTLVSSIVAKKHTVITNLGDSRAYTYTNGELVQLTEDHTRSGKLAKEGIIEKADIRFHKQNHLINSGLGCEVPKMKIHEIIIPNVGYETLLLFSDGVTDCLSDNQIRHLVSNTSPTCKITDIIVDKALSTNTSQQHLCPNDYWLEIEGGHDNTTAVALVRKE